MFQPSRVLESCFMSDCLFSSSSRCEHSLSKLNTNDQIYSGAGVCFRNYTLQRGSIVFLPRIEWFYIFLYSFEKSSWNWWQWLYFFICFLMPEGWKLKKEVLCYVCDLLFYTKQLNTFLSHHSWIRSTFWCSCTVFSKAARRDENCKLDANQ